jgi:hypothetical protein
MTKKEASIYFAGFFDGEGYVGLLKRTRGKYIEHFIQLSIGQKDGKVMDWVKENFGGHLHLVKRDGSYYWIASNKSAYRILKRITPYLKYKRPQAELAIRFIEERPKVRQISKEEMARRDDIYARLKSEKRVFTKSQSINVRRFND